MSVETAARSLPPPGTCAAPHPAGRLESEGPHRDWVGRAVGHLTPPTFTTFRSSNQATPVEVLPCPPSRAITSTCVRSAE